MQVHLTERAGVAVTVTELVLVADFNGFGGPGITVSGSEAWSGDENRMAAHGTLTSKPLTISEASPEVYAQHAEARIT